MRTGVPAALAAAAAVALLVPAAPAQSPAQARARAAVVTGSLGELAAVTATGDARRHADAPASTPQGIAFASGEATASATRAGGDARATASAVARSVALLGGVVTAYGVRSRAEDDGAGVTYSAAVRGLRIDGRTIGDVASPASYDLDGHGTVWVDRGGAGLRVTLTAALDSFPAGTTVTVADVGARARDGAPPVPTATATSTPQPTPTATATPSRTRPRAARPAAPRWRRRLLGRGFTFPVRGATRIGGPFGAARADTGFHEGNDLFADFGTPVVAVADGTVQNVGTLRISGNRLWVYADTGDRFFYAHLSAFSPNAVDGRHVAAGTLLGYVGNTGDAEPTPSHLHFEVHPDGGAAVDPHPFLLAWQARDGEPSADTSERPGALVEVRDLIADG